MHAYTYDYTPPRPADRRGNSDESQMRRYRRIGGGSKLRSQSLTRQQRSYNTAVRRARKAAAKNMKPVAAVQATRKIEFPDWVQLTPIKTN